jgi:4-diphosphocytidyl-2-C-methyl-D-erythritol kinase
VAAPLDFGDELTAIRTEGGGEGRFRLECDQTDVPLDDSNLILKAAHAFAEATGWPARSGSGGVDFKLVKRIPMGAGLGGGSSNAVAALRALNTLSGELLSGAQLEAIAAKLGSDCALFLRGAPVIMRGRGERIEALRENAAIRLRGQRVLLFKPSFGISTPWAYGRMAAEAPQHYLPAPEAERKLAEWVNSSAPVSGLLFNNMEGVAFGKFIALPVLLAKLRAEFGVAARMSGSGSACFALLGEPLTGSISRPTEADPPVEQVARLKQLIRQSWGDAVFLQEAHLL